MTISEVIKKIDRYLKKDNVGSLVVDVQNKGQCKIDCVNSEKVV